MRLLGFDETEIQQTIRSSFDLDLMDELEQLQLAKTNQP